MQSDPTLYRGSNLGVALEDSLTDLVDQGRLEADFVGRFMRYFDQV